MSDLNRRGRLFALLLYVFLSGCATYNRVTNVAITDVGPLIQRQQLEEKSAQSNEGLLFLSFSGGGTRAAAFSYGVLQELRDTRFTRYGKEKRLLDEVDNISSVSGGSFTAAYYGLFGEQIFEDYETVFLKKNVQKVLVNGLLNPLNWFRFLGSGFDRSEFAIDYYDREIFRESTFADMAAHAGPRIEINATDLSIGQRFSFNEARFDLLCSDLSEFKVARAVAASSAVPVAFAPIALQNYDTCEITEPAWLQQTRERAQTNPRLNELVKAVDSYLDKDKRRFIHLVDGGISDNLGIRALYDRVEILGGARNAAEMMGGKIPRVVAVIVVNSQTNPAKPMDQSGREPKTGAVVGAVSSAQLNRYNVETISLMENSLKQWAAELSSDGHEVRQYFIQLDFESIEDPKTRFLFENVATSLALPPEEVDKLKEAGRQLLRNSPEFQELLAYLRSLDQTR